MEPIPVWMRPLAVDAGREAHVLFVCFANGALADVPLSASRFGVPSRESLGLLDVREHERATNAVWFDHWRDGALAKLAAHDLGHRRSELDAADRCVTIDARVRDPKDAAYLQAAWGVARWMAARGASVMLDAHAMTFLHASTLPPPSAALDARTEVRMVFETDASEDGGHILHTRGLHKLGRPDLVTVCAADEGEMLAEILWQLAETMVAGAMPGSPRHGVDLPDGRTWYLEADRGFADELGLQNDARILVDEAGRWPRVG